MMAGYLAMKERGGVFSLRVDRFMKRMEIELITHWMEYDACGAYFAYPGVLARKEEAPAETAIEAKRLGPLCRFGGDMAFA